MWRVSFARALLLLVTLQCVRSYVNITHVECNSNKDRCVDPKCQITKEMRNRLTFLDVSCYFHKPAHTLILRVTLYRKKGQSYERYFLDVTQDLCEVLKQTNKNKLVRTLMEKLVDHVKGVKCPVSGNVTSSRMPLQVPLVPGMFMAKEYKLVFALNADNAFAFGFNMTFKIVKG